MSCHIHHYFEVREIWKDSLFASLWKREAFFVVPAGRERLYLERSMGEGEIFPHARPVLTWSGLVRFLGEKLEHHGIAVASRRQIDPPDHWLILRHLWEVFGKEFPRDLQPQGLRYPGVVEELGGILREMLREDVSSDHLEALWGSPLGEGNSRNFQDASGALCWFFQAYEGYLERRNLMDSAQVASFGAGLLALGGAREILGSFFRETPLVFLGFLSFATGQLRLVRELIALGGEVHLWVPATGLAPYEPLSGRGFYSAAAQLGEETEGLPFRGERKLFRLSGADRAMTAETLARELALWSLGKGYLEKEPFPGWEHIALVAPEEEITPLREALHKYGLPVAPMDPLPVRTVPWWGLFRRTLHLMGESWPGEETAYLLAHPFYGGALFPLEKALQALPRGREKWRTFMAQELPFLQTLWQGVEKYEGILKGGKSPEEVLRGTKDFFEETLNLGEKVRHLGALSQDMDFAAREIHGIFQEMERKLLFYKELVPDVGEAAREPLSFGESQLFLDTWAEETALMPPPACRKGMPLFRGSLPILFESPWLCWLGVTPSRWPGPLRETSFPTEEERLSLQNIDEPHLHRVHLPLAGERRMARHALFRRIMAGAREGVLCCSPLQDSKGRPLGECSFLQSAWEGEYPWCREEKPPLERSLGEMLIPWDQWHFARLEVPRDKEGAPRKVPGMRYSQYREKRGSLSRLDNFGACPFRYYGENVLPPPPGIFDYNPRKAGELLHALWEELFKEGTSPTEQHFRELWNPLVEKHYPQLENTLARQGRLLRYRAWTGFLALQDMEHNLGGTLVHRRVEENLVYEGTSRNIPFYGRADRIDVLQGNRVVLVDYKLGESSRYKGALQLGAYALGLQARGESVQGWGYFGLRDRRMAFVGDEELQLLYKGSKTSSRSSEPSLEESLQQAKNMLENWAQALSQGTYVPNYESPYCPSCPYRTLCRREEMHHHTWNEDMLNDEN